MAVMQMLVISCCVALATCSYGGSDAYRGRFMGRCNGDGIYYSNVNSFVLCSGGTAYHQQCAPGTQNTPFLVFRAPEFCAVNLVDNQLVLHTPSSGYVPPHPPMNLVQSGSGYMGYGPPPAMAPPARYPRRVPSPPAPHRATGPPPAMPPPASYPRRAPSAPAPHRAPAPATPSYSSGQGSQSSSDYQGFFTGRCSRDGIYYKDESTFIQCVDRRPYTQTCPPGTRNRPFGLFRAPEFCAVNLVDNQLVLHKVDWRAG